MGFIRLWGTVLMCDRKERFCLAGVKSYEKNNFCREINEHYLSIYIFLLNPLENYNIVINFRRKVFFDLKI